MRRQAIVHPTTQVTPQDVPNVLHNNNKRKGDAFVVLYYCEIQVLLNMKYCFESEMHLLII